ncbi:MAG: hypothetical protein NVSMB32_13340 [Actinomycetota bacterium]
MFQARVGGTTIQGVDLIELSENDEIAELTVFVRPLAGLTALAHAMRARMAPPGAKRQVVEASG